MSIYYNEIEPSAVLWLQAAMDEGIVAQGVIDARSIEDVKPDELVEFTQCHFFAGIGGWSIALRLAGWPDDKPVWTGSCPCQPFSTAGKGAGVNDARHLWPAWFWLIQQCHPEHVFGEQVANAVTKGWLDDVAHDLESEGYAVGSSIIPACSVGAPHKRDRLWFVANRTSEELEGAAREGLYGRGNGFTWRGTMGNAEHNGQSATKHVADTRKSGLEGYGQYERQYGSQRWQNSNGYLGAADIRWINCPDGKARPVKSGLCLLADGIPAKLRKAALHGYGNAIHPEVAAEFIEAAEHAIYMGLRNKKVFSWE